MNIWGENRATDCKIYTHTELNKKHVIDILNFSALSRSTGVLWVTQLFNLVLSVGIYTLKNYLTAKLRKSNGFFRVWSAVRWAVRSKLDATSNNEYSKVVFPKMNVLYFYKNYTQMTHRSESAHSEGKKVFCHIVYDN